MKNKLTLAIALIVLSMGFTNAQVSKLSPMIYLNFDDSTSTDKSVNSFKTTVSGSPTYTSGMVGNSIQLDGTNDHISFGKDSMFDFGGDRSISISFWYKVPTNDGANANSGFRIRPIISKMDGSSANTDYLVFIEDKFDGDGAFIKWGTGNSSSAASWMLTKEPSKNAWHHVVTTMGIKKHSGLKYFVKNIYIDCKLVKTDSSTVKGSKQNVNLYIGRGFDDNTAKAYYFKGQIDELVVFDRELSDSESLWLCDKANYTSTTTSRNSSLKGKVKTQAGDPLDSSKVHLCQINWADSTIVIKYTSNTALDGGYEFSNLPNNETYFLAAEPDTFAHKWEMPTFYDKSLFITSAQEIVLNMQDSIINFQTYNQFDPAGNYSLSGNVFSCAACKKGGSGNPIKNLNVIVTDEFGRKIANLLTDSKGNFKINRLKNGTYYFFANRPGATNKNAASVVINNGNVKSLSLSFNGESLKIDQITGLEEGNEKSLSNQISLLNLNSNQLLIKNNSTENINYNLVDMNGRSLIKGSLNSSNNQILDLKSGVYILNGKFTSGNVINQKVIIR